MASVCKLATMYLVFNLKRNICNTKPSIRKQTK